MRFKRCSFQAVHCSAVQVSVLANGTIKVVTATLRVFHRATIMKLGATPAHLSG